MKVSIGTNLKEGPWGGGNLFAINLSNFLKDNDHHVVFDLFDDDIDIILLTEPRKTSESSAFTHIDVNNYLKYKNNNAIVVHRINECDERKNTNNVNEYLIDVNKSADYTVFVSNWLMSLFENQGISHQDKKVILAGADTNVFNSKNFSPWVRGDKLKIVTHHWGNNWNKGFEIYQRIDNMLNQDNWKDKIHFTYIGNVPNEFKFFNATHIEPLSGKKLAEELKKNHLYVTASRNEPSGNHHIEAAQCSLPLLYVESGGIPEYCNGFGLSFNNDNFEEKLEEIIDNYDEYLNAMSGYPFSSNKMSNEYLELFYELKNDEDKIIKKRQNKDLYTNKFYFFKILNFINLIKKLLFTR